MSNGDICLDGLCERYPDLEACRNDISDAIEMLADGFRAGSKLLVCGNGGSAADSEHIVGELMKSFVLPRPVDEGFAERYRALFGRDAPSWLEGALPCISLVSHTALSTAFSNDHDAEGVFAQQVYSLGREGDMLLAISTSGNSANVVEAAKVAQAKGMHVIGLTGAKDSALSDVCDICIQAPASETYRIQELHLPIYHTICAQLESTFFGSS